MYLRHVKSAESLISSHSCPADLPYKSVRRGANRSKWKRFQFLLRPVTISVGNFLGSLRETTPLHDGMPPPPRRAPTSTTTMMKPCLATDLDAVYSSNESQLFGALHPRYDQRRCSAMQHHVPYAISVHVNLGKFHGLKIRGIRPRKGK